MDHLKIPGFEPEMVVLLAHFPKVGRIIKVFTITGARLLFPIPLVLPDILEKLAVEQLGELPIFTRTLNVTPSNSMLRVRVAPDTTSVAVFGEGVSLSN